MNDERTRLVALTHLPSPRMGDAIRSFIDIEPIDVALATEQHAAYRAALTRCGAHVVVLDANLTLPDCVFIEDTAVVLDEVAILTSMGAKARAKEPEAIGRALAGYRREVATIDAPSTLEGGDVLRVGRTLYVGKSTRTNDAGIQSLTATAARFGYTVRVVRVDGYLHLKTVCTALPDGRLLLNPHAVEMRDLDGVATCAVDGREPTAANVALVNGRIVAALSNPRTVAALIKEGFDVEVVDLSEFAKAEGSVTCLSLLFAPPP
jgi:dimethylargininase